MPFAPSAEPCPDRPWMLDLTHPALPRPALGADALLRPLSDTLGPPRPVLVVVGGAGGLSPADSQQLAHLFDAVIAPYAQHHGLVVVDGGTDYGVMQLMGRSRARHGGTFPLVGVVVHSKVRWPQQTAADDSATLEGNHSHFVLVPGDRWGDESLWLAQVATQAAGSEPSLTLLINGGLIALQEDVPHSLAHQRPVVVLAGSGRAADQVAAALAPGGGPAKSPTLVDPTMMQPIVDSGLVQAVALHNPAALIQSLDQHLGLTTPPLVPAP